MKEKIKKYMEEKFAFKFNGEISQDTDLFKAGLIDSFGYMELMNYLEEEFNFEMTDEEMLLDVLVSLSNISEFVNRKVA